MDYPELNVHKERLHQQAFSELLQKNEEQTQICTHFQNKHKQVLEGLQIIPLELTINCLVPIGKQALMEGKLKHTNEILVCLGEGYFINYTAVQAIELCNRRIKRFKKLLNDLKEERNLFESRQNFPVSYGAFEGNLSEEIIEYWNDQDLDTWRAQHRQREKAYHEKITEQKQQRQSFSETEEDLFRRLDELELEEELADEYYRLQEDVDDNDCDGEDKEAEEAFCESKGYEEMKIDTVFDEVGLNVSEKDITRPFYVEMKKVGKYLTSDISVSFLKETNENHVIRTNENPKKENHFCKSHALTNQLVKDRRVSFADVYDVNSSDIDESAFQTSEISLSNCVLNYQKINFSHSKVFPQLTDDSNRMLNSPGDIYNIFYKPKSILKCSRNALLVNDNTSLPKEYAFDPDFEIETVGTSVFDDVVTKLVHEKQVGKTQAEIQSLSKKRPVSRFKLERTSSNKQ